MMKGEKMAVDEGGEKVDKGSIESSSWLRMKMREK